MPTAIIPSIIIIPITIALSATAWSAWKRRKRTEAAKVSACTPPEGTISLARGQHDRSIRASLVGTYLLVGLGTYGLNQLVRLLNLLYRCGLQKIVGGILVAENDAQVLATFLPRIPTCYHDRVVLGSHRSFGGGMANEGTRHVLDKIDLWGMPVIEATREVIDRHLRLNESRAPGMICVFDGLGGQSPVGIPVLCELRDEFSESLMVGFTCLPAHTRLRTRYPLIKQAYEKHGLFGWVLSDNLGEDPVTADYGMVATIVALADAALYEDRATQPNNAIKLALTQGPGGILVYQVVSGRVVAYPCSCGNTDEHGYYTYTDPVFTHAMKGLRALEDNAGSWSADVPRGHEDSTFDMVLANIPHADLSALSDSVTAARGLRRRILHSTLNGSAPPDVQLLRPPNHELVFASVAAPIDPDKPNATITTIRLRAVSQTPQALDELVKAPHERGVPASIAQTTRVKSPLPEPLVPVEVN